MSIASARPIAPPYTPARQWYPMAPIPHGLMTTSSSVSVRRTWRLPCAGLPFRATRESAPALEPLLSAVAAVRALIDLCARAGDEALERAHRFGGVPRVAWPPGQRNAVERQHCACVVPIDPYVGDVALVAWRPSDGERLFEHLVAEGHAVLLLPRPSKQVRSSRARLPAFSHRDVRALQPTNT